MGTHAPLDREVVSYGMLDSARRRARRIAALLLVASSCTPAEPPNGETVVLLHGLGRSAASMALLASRLEHEGFRVVNVDYPSRTQPIESHVRLVEDVVRTCCSAFADSVHFVTHSMGGVIARAYLDGKPTPHAGRVVMLSPPNRGSELVDVLVGSPLLEALLGPSGARLGTDNAALPATLGPVDFELGVMTGVVSANPIGSWLIPGEDDGMVGVESARVRGLDAFKVVPASHTFIMNRRAVADDVVLFLREGRFSEPAAPEGR